MELSTPDGPMPVFAAHGIGEVRRGVLVIHDAFGVTNYVERVATDLADAGWCSLAPHLFHRDGSPVIPFNDFPRAEGHLRSLTGPAILVDLDACFGHFATLGIPAHRMAVIGFCMGGTVAHLAATARPLGAAVTFYGQAGASPWEGVAPGAERTANLQAPWLGLFGETDPIVPVADVERLRGVAEQVAVATRIVTYPGAGHAFHRSVTPGTFHAESAADAWRECTEWLDNHVPFFQPMALFRRESTQP